MWVLGEIDSVATHGFDNVHRQELNGSLIKSFHGIIISLT
jgi:hypothetical protein